MGEMACEICGDYIEMCSHEDMHKKVAQQAERMDALKKVLEQIANIAHHGGLTGLGVNDIRRLTLPYWDKAECSRLAALEGNTDDG